MNHSIKKIAIEFCLCLSTVSAFAQRVSHEGLALYLHSGVSTEMDSSGHRNNAAASPRLKDKRADRKPKAELDRSG